MIKPKEKKCKGIGITQGYGCGDLTLYRQNGLCKKKCYPSWLLESDAGKARLQKALLKVTKPRLDLEQAEREKKDRTKISYLLVNVRNICHEYIRERDRGLPCISCGGLWQSDHQAGHFYKAELYSTLKFDERNISNQCVGCNIRKDGNESGYRVGIMNRYGKEHLELLDELAATEKQTTHKWDRQELENTRNYYKEKLKKLKQ